MRIGAPWVCPRCGRQFARPKQAHSCRVRALDEHFRGKSPQLRLLFDALMRALRRSGPLRVDAVGSSINLVSGHHFAGIAVRRDYLRVGFILNHRLEDPRILRSERLGPHRIHHQVCVRSRADLDARLLDWLAQAQAMQARRGKPAG